MITSRFTYPFTLFAFDAPIGSSSVLVLLSQLKRYKLLLLPCPLAHRWEDDLIRKEEEGGHARGREDRDGWLQTRDGQNEADLLNMSHSERALCM